MNKSNSRLPGEGQNLPAEAIWVSICPAAFIRAGGEGTREQLKVSEG